MRLAVALVALCLSVLGVGTGPAHAATCLTPGWDCPDPIHEVLPGVGIGYIFKGMRAALAEQVLAHDYGHGVVTVTHDSDGDIIECANEDEASDICINLHKDGIVHSVWAENSSVWYIVTPHGPDHLLSAPVKELLHTFGEPSDAEFFMGNLYIYWQASGLLTSWQADITNPDPYAALLVGVEVL